MLNSREVKDYLSHHHLPQLLESLLTGLLYHHPEDPISFLHSCLIKTRQLGGPKAVNWDTFIHLERHQPRQGPPRPKCVPLKAPFAPTRPSYITPRSTSGPPHSTPAGPKTTAMPSTTPQIPQTMSQISAITPQITPKTSTLPSKPHKTPPILQASVLIPQTPSPKTQTIPPLLQTTLPNPPASASTPWIIPPAFVETPPTHSGPQTYSVKPKITVLPPIAPQIPSVNNEIIFGPQQRAPGQYPKLLPSSPPGPTVSPPPIIAEVSKDKETTTVTTEGPRPLTIQSQLSIDSDSDMTESSGLQQEVSIKPPQKPRPIIIFIIGGPASGKGSQAVKLAQSFNLRVISLDELLRRQLLSQASPSKKWEIISQMMSHGELGPQEETISELRRQLIGEQEVKGFIVDGFPRDVHQALSFQEQAGSPDLVMLLLCSNDTLRCRLQRRATELGLLGDSSHALRKRLDTFQREIISLRRYYKQLNLLRQVDADRDEDQVFADLSSVIRKKLTQKESSDRSDIPACSSAAVPSN